MTDQSNQYHPISESGRRASSTVRISDAGELGILAYFLVLIRAWKWIVSIAMIGSLIAILLTYTIEPTYRAETSFVHASNITGSPDASRLTTMQIVVSRLGVNLGSGNSSLVDLFPAVLKGRSLLYRVLDRTFPLSGGSSRTLLSYLSESGDREVAVQKLRSGILQVSVDAASQVTRVSITLEDAVLSASVANACVEELDRFSRETINSHSAEQRVFIQDRLNELDLQLQASEDALRRFREQNRSIANSPQLLLKEERLLRDVETNMQVYLELRKRNEVVKIEEVKSVPLLVILDQAQPPLQKHSPRRGRILFSSFLVFALLGCLAVLIRDVRNSHPRTRSNQA